MRIDGMAARSELSRFARVAGQSFEESSVATRDMPQLVEQGFEAVRVGKHRARLRREKDLDKQIEHRVWFVLYQMGFTQLSVEGGATLRMEGNIHNQIDAVAYDDEVGVIVECKSSESETVRKVDGQGLIARLSDHRSKVRDVINAERPRDNKLKVGAILVLWNSAVTETDRERARQEHILILDNAALNYYERLVKLIGFAARYQLLSETFPNQQISGLNLAVPAVESSMGGRTVYTFAIPPAHLLKIAYIAHRARNDFGTYQRMVTPSRLTEIREYIDEGGIFPTNIVINFASDTGERTGLRFDAGTNTPGGVNGVKQGILYLPNKYQSAWIIDGQHRLLSFSGHKWAESSSLCVTAFDGLNASDQAELFVKINSNQRKVSANHLTTLLATLNWVSADPKLRIGAIISKGIQELRLSPESPFFNRIVLADESKTITKCITLSEFQKVLERPGLFILQEQKRQVRQFGVLWTGDSDSTLIRTKQVLNTWFGKIKAVAQIGWDAGDGSGGLVATNRGVTSCIMVLKHVCDYLRSKDTDLALRPDKDLCGRLVEFAQCTAEFFADLSDVELQGLRGHYGAGAPTELAWRICAHLRRKYEDFAPAGLVEWQAERAVAKVTETQNLTTSIERRLHEGVLETLKSSFQEEWWHKVPLKVRQAAVLRKEEDLEDHPVETYLNLIHYRDIILSHWQLFERQFGFGRSGRKEDRTEWMVTINDIRNKASHASGARLKMQDYEKAVEIDQWLHTSGL